MKGLKVNMDMVNCGLLLVVLVLVVMCCVKREGYQGGNQVHAIKRYDRDGKIAGVQRGLGGTGGINGVLGNMGDGASGMGQSRKGGRIAKGVKRVQQ